MRGILLFHKTRIVRRSSYVDSVDECSVSESCTENANDRDEVKEVLKLAKKETARVRVWRLIVLVTLLITGAVLIYIHV